MKLFVFVLSLLSLTITAAFAKVDVEKVVSPNGIEAWLVSDATVPMIALEASFEGGLSHEPKGKEGLATLFAGLLEEGAGALDAQAFAKQADELGAYFTYEARADSLNVSARMLKKNLTESVSLLALSLAEPQFPEDAFVRVQQQILSSIAQKAVRPSTLASEAWGRTMLPNARYGQPQMGTEASVTGLTRQDVVDAYAAFLNRNQLKVAVVGDITAAELAEVLDTLFYPLPDAPQKVHPPVTVAQFYPQNITTPVDVPQASIQFGHVGLLRQDPDYIPLSIVNYILGGGGFASRLTEVVREDNGLVYSIGSYLLPYQRVGLYIGNLATSNGNVDKAIDLVTQQWALMAQYGMTEAELQNAKTYLTGAFPLRFDSNTKIAQYLISAKKYNLGIDYINKYPDLINAVTIEQVNAAARTHLHPDKLLFSIAGQPQDE